MMESFGGVRPCASCARREPEETERQETRACVCVERTKKSSVRPHGESILGRISLKGSRTNTWSESC